MSADPTRQPIRGSYIVAKHVGKTGIPAVEMRRSKTPVARAVKRGSTRPHRRPPRAGYQIPKNAPRNRYNYQLRLTGESLASRVFGAAEQAAAKAVPSGG